MVWNTKIHRRKYRTLDTIRKLQNWSTDTKTTITLQTRVKTCKSASLRMFLHAGLFFWTMWHKSVFKSSRALCKMNERKIKIQVHYCSFKPRFVWQTTTENPGNLWKRECGPSICSCAEKAGMPPRWRNNHSHLSSFCCLDAWERYTAGSVRGAIRGQNLRGSLVRTILRERSVVILN